ncbi:6-bladed beta-propeller [Pedobacter vanadiisoli]|uniref:6-bladed beta-propeller n=1 Tax=Pedobacter vanadiisoli TaxID=1761975 RepID=A0ABW5MCB2_9SPHI
MKKSFLLLFITILFLASCVQKSKEQKLNIPTTEINISAFKETVFEHLPENIVANKRYVNLEMKGGDNYIGLIDKILFKNNIFYVLDVRMKSLVAFDGAGNYIGKIGKLNQDYLNIADFDVDENGTIYIVDGKADNFLIYSREFSLVRTIKSPFEIDVVQRLPNGEFLLGLSSWNKKNNANDKIIRVDKNLAVLEKSLTYDQFIDDNFWISRYRFIKSNDSVFYNRPIDNEVFVFSLDGRLRKAYYFNFGLMNVPDADKTEIDSKISKYNKYRMLTNFTFVNGKYGFGKIWDKRKFKFFFLDIVQKRIYLEDLSTSNELTNLADFDGKHLVSYISAAQFDDKGLSKLPIQAREHLTSGGFVICDIELE